MVKNRGYKRKLLDVQVKEIRRLYRRGGITMKELAEQYNVSKPAIHNVIRRKSHRHI